MVLTPGFLLLGECRIQSWPVLDVRISMLSGFGVQLRAGSAGCMLEYRVRLKKRVVLLFQASLYTLSEALHFST